MFNLTIRRLTGDDIAAATTILDAAFNPAPWPEGLIRSLWLQPDGMLLAERAGQPVGLVSGVDYGPFAYVGMLGVHPSARRLGVAHALMEALLAWLDRRGCPRALLDATADGAPLYAQLGFIDAGCSALAVGAAATSPAPLPAGVERLDPGDLAALATFDTPIFGADRSAVLADLAASYPERLLVTRDPAGAISGYLVAQARTLGPWVARSLEDAGRLLQAGLACGFAQPPRVLIPGGNPRARKLLEAAGIVVKQELRYMRRGRPGRPGEHTACYGLASFALG